MTRAIFLLMIEVLFLAINGEDFNDFCFPKTCETELKQLFGDENINHFTALATTKLSVPHILTLSGNKAIVYDNALLAICSKNPFDKTQKGSPARCMRDAEDAEGIKTWWSCFWLSDEGKTYSKEIAAKTSFDTSIKLEKAINKVAKICDSKLYDEWSKPVKNFHNTGDCVQRTSADDKQYTNFLNELATIRSNRCYMGTDDCPFLDDIAGVHRDRHPKCPNSGPMLKLLLQLEYSETNPTMAFNCESNFDGNQTKTPSNVDPMPILHKYWSCSIDIQTTTRKQPNTPSDGRKPKPPNGGGKPKPPNDGGKPIPPNVNWTPKPMPPQSSFDRNKLKNVQCLSRVIELTKSGNTCYEPWEVCNSRQLSSSLIQMCWQWYINTGKSRTWCYQPLADCNPKLTLNSAINQPTMILQVIFIIFVLKST